MKTRPYNIVVDMRIAWFCMPESFSHNWGRIAKKNSVMFIFCVSRQRNLFLFFKWNRKFYRKFLLWSQVQNEKQKSKTKFLKLFLSCFCSSSCEKGSRKKNFLILFLRSPESSLVSSCNVSCAALARRKTNFSHHWLSQQQHVIIGES